MERGQDRKKKEERRKKSGQETIKTRSILARDKQDQTQARVTRGTGGEGGEKKRRRGGGGKREKRRERMAE